MTDHLVIDAALRLNPQLRAQRLDVAGRPQWLLELDDANARTQRLAVPDRTWSALQRLTEATPCSRWLDALQAEGWSEPECRRLRETVLPTALSRHVVMAAGSEAFSAPPQPRAPRYLLAMWTLLPPSAVNPIARLLAPLFSRAGLVLCVLLGLAGQALLLQALAQPRFFLYPRPGEVLLTVVLVLAALLAHELGHAAAAWRLGARRVSIGVGWYLVFPVAWADLSEIWRFSAPRRAVVDIAGVLLQLVAVGVILLGYAVTGHAAWLAAAVAASLSALWNLNPLLRLDGYWLLSDLLGRSHLRADAWHALGLRWNRHAPRRWRIRIGSRPVMSERLGLALALYALAATVALGVVCVLAAQRAIDAVRSGLPHLADRIAAHGVSSHPPAELALLVGSLLWKLALVALLLVALLHTLWRGARALRRRHPDAAGRR